LFDGNAPVPWERFLKGYEAIRGGKLGWRRLVNGRVPAAAEEAEFRRSRHLRSELALPAKPPQQDTGHRGLFNKPLANEAPGRSPHRHSDRFRAAGRLLTGDFANP
jgi:hypothetical protein